MTLSSALLPALFLLLFFGGLALQLLARQREIKKREDERFSTALNRHERVNLIDPTGPNELSTKATVDDAVPLVPRIFGFNPLRLDLYPAPPQVVIAVSLAIACLIAMIGTMMLGMLALLAAPVIWPGVSRIVFSRWHRQRKATLFEQFPDALAMVVRGVRVGIPIGEAISNVARDNAQPTSGEFARVAEQLLIGLPLDEALRRMAERNDLPEYRFFATALALQSQTGGNLSETLEGLADVIRKRIAARDRGYALAAEARTSSNVLAVLPVLLFIALWFMNPNYIISLISEHSGHIILGATLLLLGFGIMAMRFLIQKSLS